MEGEMGSRLVRLCIESATESRFSVERWRRQRRTLESLPSPLADALLHRLLHRRLLFPSLLEVFKYSAEVIDLKGENTVDAEWMAYLGAFRRLRSLVLADCRRITNSAIWNLSGMGSLKELDLSRCGKINDAGIKHLLSISILEVLRIPETGVTADGVALLSSLTNLSVLDLGGLPVTDKALSSLQVLSKLEQLDLWGSKISNKGAIVLQMFPKLSFLNLAWTSVSKLPTLSSLECLNLSNCSINSVLEGDGDKAPISKLILSGVTFLDESESFLYIETSFLKCLDISNSSLHGFSFLPFMKELEHLDLSSTVIGDDSVEAVACIGANLRNLNLSKTRVTSSGVAVLAGHVPRLEYLSLAHSPVDDSAISYISMMPSLKTVDLSNTNVRGFIKLAAAEPSLVPSLTALHCLNGLESLYLDHASLSDAALEPLPSIQGLHQLSVKSASLTDISLHRFSSMSKLTSLSIHDAVLLTDRGLVSFRPPATLKTLDLRGCWLLSVDAISSFSMKYPSIEVRHEVLGVSASGHNSSDSRSSSSQISSRPSQASRREGKMLISFPASQPFVDQRLKYTREELLALQYSTVSIGRPHG